ncbi:MAG: acyl carrier protein [Flavobacteriaceae bacterium]|nr:acyl carrier protein [Flavobacteriaceae bacterium]
MASLKIKIVKILNEIRPEFDFSEPIDNFIEVGMLDSFDVVTLVTSLDEEFKISIDGVDILPENFATLECIVDLLKKYVDK